MAKLCYTTSGLSLCFLVALLPMVVDALWLRDTNTEGGEVGKIVKFRLIDADTDLPIMDLKNGQVLVLPLTNATNFNIDATTEGLVGSVQFGFLGNENYRVESRSPFALCANIFDDYKICENFSAGSQVVTATPYSSMFARGTMGTTVTLRFTIATDLPPTRAPLKPPTRAPLKPPTRAPLKPPTRAPLKPPTRAPLKSPTRPPLKPPSRAPLKPPTSAPKTAPVVSPKRPPTISPIKTPVNAPTSTQCVTPKFVDESWQTAGPQYPIPRIGEPQGLLVGNDLVIFSGFINNFNDTTNHTYARDVTDSNSVWRQMDDMPLSSGVTHAATLVIGTKVHLCGGYMGGHPGPHVPYCFVYDHSILPGQRKQWTRITDLPGGGSAGGGMIYDTDSNSLFYSGGGQRRQLGSAHPVDVNSTWKFQFSRPGSGWVTSTPIPYRANHLSYVTHTDEQGKERHYFLGGQVGENECCTNFGLNYEFIASTETWVKRASIPLARGHASSSTRAIGCGFVMVGGSINSGSGRRARTDDISFYDIPTDKWTSGIGILPKESATPIVDIHSDGNMYYVTGLPNQSRRRISA